MESPKCCICHGTLEGIIACRKCMAPIHSGCADFKGDGPCGITYNCDGQTTDGSKEGNTTVRSDRLEDSKDARFRRIQEAYERVERYQVQPQSIFPWYHLKRWITSSISEKEGIEYIAWRLAQPSVTAEEGNSIQGGLRLRWSDQCLEFSRGESRSDSDVNNGLVAARLAKGLPPFCYMDDDCLVSLASFYPPAYEQVVKDLIVVERYPEAMAIARESEILPLIKKASYCIGAAYQQIGDQSQLALDYFIEGGHTSKIIELAVNTVSNEPRLPFFVDGFHIDPPYKRAVDYLRKNNDFKSLYLLGKACDQGGLQNEAQSALYRFGLATSMGDAKGDSKELADPKTPLIDVQTGKSRE